jgi:hypothetical protein
MFLAMVIYLTNYQFDNNIILDIYGRTIQYNFSECKYIIITATQGDI